MGKKWWAVVAVFGLVVAVLGYFYKDLPFKHAVCAVEVPATLQCPTPSSKGYTSLSNAHLATGLIVGFNPGYGLIETIQQITSALKTHGETLKINILYSTTDEQEDTEEELKALRSSPDRALYNFIPVKDREAVWTQDFMEVVFDTKQRRSALVDLPYRPEEGEGVPKELGSICSMQTIAAPDLNIDQSGLASISSAYGGNIEALNKEWFMWGKDIPHPTAAFFKDLGQTNALEFSLSWLQAGHIDEVLTTLPIKTNKPGQCDTAIAYASPRLALDLLKQPSNADRALEAIPATQLRYQQFHGCQAELSSKQTLSEPCKELVRANQRYDDMIASAAKDSAEILAKADACVPSVLRIPALYYPDMLLEEYGSKNDNATSAYPNAINGISLNSVYIAPKQSRPQFEEAIQDALQTIGINAVFVNGDALHKLGGGLHCWSQVLRTCR